MATFSFTGPGGQDVPGRVRSLIKAANITEGDGLMFGQLVRTIVVERTQHRGVDVNGAPFHPYSENGPYYDYSSAGKAGGKLTRQQRRNAAGRRFKAIGGAKSGAKRTSIGIKYESYGAFKRSLGRSRVDLTGSRAPHMMQAIQVRTAGAVLPGSATREIAADSNTKPITQVEVGFYGAEAARAKGHNEGAAHLPRRRFFAVSRKEMDLIANLIKKRIELRMGGRGGR